MRKNYYKEQYNSTNIKGSVTTKLSETLFNGGIYLPQEIVVDTNDIVYYENSKGEQINETKERELGPKIFSSNNRKIFWSEIKPVLNKEITVNTETLNNLQVSTINEFDVWEESEFNGKYQLEFNQKELLKEYVFSSIKSKRVFKDLLIKDTNKGVNNWINKWVVDNILPYYQFKNVELKISYREITNASDSNKIGQSRWNTDTNISPTLVNTIWEWGKDNVILEWNLEKDYKIYNIDYYYIPKWEKIVGNI